MKRFMCVLLVLAVFAAGFSGCTAVEEESYPLTVNGTPLEGGVFRYYLDQAFADPALPDRDARIAYDRSSHEYTIDIQGTHIKANQQKIEMESPQQIHLTTQQLLLTIGGTTMELNGSSAVINTSNITFTGNMDVTGTLHTSGDISTAGGVSASGAVHGSNI